MNLDQEPIRVHPGVTAVLLGPAIRLRNDNRAMAQSDGAVSSGRPGHRHRDRVGQPGGGIPLQGRGDAGRIGPDHLIPSRFDRLHPLGLVPQGKTRHGVKIGLFLHPTAIGGDQCRVFLQHDHIQIAQGLDGTHVGGQGQAKLQ